MKTLALLVVLVALLDRCGAVGIKERISPEETRNRAFFVVASFGFAIASIACILYLVHICSPTEEQRERKKLAKIE
jgi:hypothetical protein